MWELVNRNKRSIAIDLRKPEGQALLHRLVAEADVFLTNLLPRTLEAFGASPEKLMAVNPRLVYAQGGGLGSTGELANTAAQDTTGTAASGFMYTASRDDDPDVPAGRSRRRAVRDEPGVRGCSGASAPREDRQGRGG